MKNFEDDGRTVVSMDLLNEEAPSRRWMRRGSRQRPSQAAEPEPMSKRETRQAIFAAMGAALLVGLVFAAGLLAFVWFCLNVWFK